MITSVKLFIGISNLRSNYSCLTRTVSSNILSVKFGWKIIAVFCMYFIIAVNIWIEGYINSKNREALIKDQIQQLRLDTMFPALQGDGIPRGSSQKDLSDYTAKIESLMEELKKEWVESVIRYERIRKAINKMNDEQEKEALTRYYLLRENNKAIQRKMGVSKAKLYRIYDSALENFEIL